MMAKQKDLEYMTKIELDSLNDGCKVFIDPRIIGCIADLPMTNNHAPRTRIDIMQHNMIYFVKQSASTVISLCEQAEARRAKLERRRKS